MSSHRDTFTLATPDELPLRVDLRFDPDRALRAIVVVAHGFKGFRRWGFFPHVGETLARAGYASAVVQGRILVMGGEGGGPSMGTYPAVEEYDHVRRRRPCRMTT